jgi:hypothetical protein
MTGLAFTRHSIRQVHDTLAYDAPYKALLFCTEVKAWRQLAYPNPPLIDEGMPMIPSCYSSL